MPVTVLVWLTVAMQLAIHAQDSPLFRTGTTLVEFTLVAVDSEGRPVTDLQADEIVVEEDGRPRELVFFQYEGRSATVTPPTVLPTPGAPVLFSNRIDMTPGPDRNVVAVLLDALNTPAGDQIDAREAVLAYLRSAARGTRIALYRLASGFDVIHDFSDDPRLLAARLEESPQKLPVFVSRDVADLDCLAGGGCATTIEIEQLDVAHFQLQGKVRREQTLAALKALGDHLEGIPGRKSLVWIGGGMSMYSVAGCGGFGAVGGVESYEREIRAAGQRLASQGIALYPVDAKGVERSRIPPPPLPAPGDPNSRGPDDPLAPGYRGRRPGPQVQVPMGEKCAGAIAQNALRASALSNYQPESANHLLAEVTGGRMVMMTNDLAAGIKRATEDERATYSAGFYASDSSSRQWHRIDVKVNRPGVRVMHRQGFMLAPPSSRAQNWNDRQWRAAVASPLGSAAIALRADVIRDERGTLEIAVEIGATDLHFRAVRDELVAEFDIVIAEKSANEGHMRRQSGEYAIPDVGKEPEPIRHSMKLTPDGSAQSIRVLVRDKFTGKLGTLDIALQALR